MTEQAEILDLEQPDVSTEADATLVSSTQEASTWLLPFAFAKRHSVLVTTNADNGGYYAEEGYVVDLSVVHCI